MKLKKKSKDQTDDKDLLQALKNWRNKKAKILGHPPYTILHDQTIENIILLNK